ncbi:MAG: helix-turn-helix domain-containing protein [bacterium]
MNGENLRLILGLKLRQFRHKKGYTLKELATKTHLSISFLSEIEKGKKYPKPEKIMLLSKALDISFDELVSLKVDEDLDTFTTILDSPFIKGFPFHLFDIEPTSLLDLVKDSPGKAGAFIRTFLEIAQNYNMQVEHFLLAALRSYQIMHHNYFEDIEDAALAFVREHNLKTEPPQDTQKLRSLLTEKYGYDLHETTFEHHRQLREFRSVWIDGKPQKLFINANLLPIQKAFNIVKEIAFCHLDLKERSKTSSWIQVESFEQVLSNFKASYFAGAVLMYRDRLQEDLAGFFDLPRWNGQEFLNIMQKYDATPEMFLYRLSQLLPKLFGLHKMYYLRFYNRSGRDSYNLTKVLNMSPVRLPYGVGLSEHYCRRWLSIRALKQLVESQKNGGALNIMIAAQRSKFLQNQDRFFNFALARPLVLTEGMNSSITLGLALDDKFKNTVKFWDDPAISDIEVNETCERCTLFEAECQDRVVLSDSYRQQKEHMGQVEHALSEFISKVEGEA